MARALAGWYSLMEANLQKRVGATRRECWPLTDSTSWHSTSEALAPPVARARLTLTPLHHKDVIAAVRYLKAHGAATVSVVGGSFGGGAAGDASIEWPGEIDRIVFLGAAPNLPAGKLKCRSLFIVARDDANADGPRLPGIRAQYERAPNPKQLIVLDGSAHAQFLFQTNQRALVMQQILKFLSAP